MDPKSLISSLTVWFNVLAFIVAVAQGFGFVNFSPDPRIGEYAAAAITIVNVLLRVFKTKQPIAR
jgi:hypothetical protein